MRYGDTPGPLAVAHRGGAGLAAENTLEAFRRSHALGVRYLETDVRLTADGQLVAFHDAGLARVTPTAGRVRRHDLRTLTALPVLGGGPVLALTDVLAAFPDACFALDLKDPAATPALARLLDESGAAARVCVAAARGSWLVELHRRVPDVQVALSWRRLAHLATCASYLPLPRGGFAHVPLRLGRVPVFRDELTLRAHDAGIRVLVWTVDDPATMHRLLDAGVDGIITDRPDLLREVLIARDEWHAPDVPVIA